ncbi:threonine ammonia-lyase IlvA [Albibacterium sp.]|uniref:threonine ammonia-lyase IlvA n=1 Tax=Albibacterium sp. TaxID=2952885 RepID=UPI002CBA839C|nr:threonine ammonia-lyase IlvA [Albibacterium sp.]HUH19199.1 threonine ammonia-lyase IlvA [Albibacterium sp.]
MTELSDITLDSVAALKRIQSVINRTPLQYNNRLSKKYNASIYLKREDMQVVRSYKLRGAYNKISRLNDEERKNGVVCASAGNHAQGFAFSCKNQQIKGVIFMPSHTPKQKIDQTRMFGESFVEIILTGDTFDDCLREALIYTKEHNMTFVPPFDDAAIIEGQGTVGVEILEDLPDVDIVIVPIGGGGLASGVGYYFNHARPETTCYGVEPEGAACMKAAFSAGKPVTLDNIITFVDGAAVKRAGDLTFELCQKYISRIELVPEGKVCSSILNLYNNDAIVAEPAGALTVASLDMFKDEIKGKKVVCIISGGNNDFDRMAEIKELSLQYEGKKHYFLVHFPQRPGALKLFVTEVMGPTDDITRFEFIKKTQRERGPALVGIEVQCAKDYQALIERMKLKGFDFKEINTDKTLFEYFI